MTEKIQKILSSFGYGSRRNIEQMIKYGSILINNRKVSIGERLNYQNIKTITLQNKTVFFKKTDFKTKVIIYNKPEGEICTKKDDKKRPTVFSKLPFLKMNRWISIGRLDINTQGLLLFTNNGNLANRLMHPKYKIEREYCIRVFGDINKNKINLLKNGVKIKDGYACFKKIDSINKEKKGKNQWFKGILCEGRNREIRLMWKAVQCQVNKLIRIRYGNIILPKNLKLGDWSELNAKSANELHNLVYIKK